MAKKSAKSRPPRKPVVGLIMGSQSDWATMRHTAETLEALGVPFEARIVSAHRTPRRMMTYAAGAKARGLQVIIAGAGGAAHLPGMTAAMTPLPVLGVPVESAALKGQDSLLSIVQMPAGIPVGTLAIGRAAIDQLDLCLRTHQYGLPEVRMHHLIEPRWQEGASMPVRAGMRQSRKAGI